MNRRRWHGSMWRRCSSHNRLEMIPICDPKSLVIPLLLKWNGSYWPLLHWWDSQHRHGLRRTHHPNPIRHDYQSLRCLRERFFPHEGFWVLLYHPLSSKDDPVWRGEQCRCFLGLSVDFFFVVVGLPCTVRPILRSNWCKIPIVRIVFMRDWEKRFGFCLEVAFMI